jgi:hypothetical protein
MTVHVGPPGHSFEANSEVGREDVRSRCAAWVVGKLVNKSTILAFPVDT